MIKEYDIKKEFCPFCGDRTYDNTAITEATDLGYYTISCSVCGSAWEEMVIANTSMDITRVYKYGDLSKLKPEVAIYVVAMRALSKGRVKNNDKRV